MEPIRLLLVEDDDDVAAAMTEILVGEGYKVERAANGAEGLASLGVRPTPKLILLDWTMPVMTGSEMARCMQREPSWSRIPIVLLTAGSEAKDKAIILHAAGYLKKPVKPDDLVRMVTAIVRELMTLRSNRSVVVGDHRNLDRLVGNG